jgi:hypothetical protein
MSHSMTKRLAACFLILLVSIDQVEELAANVGPNSGLDAIQNRIWQAGGSAELAARGKCWIDGVCTAGPSWWLGSHDDSDYAYRLSHASLMQPKTAY